MHNRQEKESANHANTIALAITHSDTLGQSSARRPMRGDLAPNPRPFTRVSSYSLLVSQVGKQAPRATSGHTAAATLARDLLRTLTDHAKGGE